MVSLQYLMNLFDQIFYFDIFLSFVLVTSFLMVLKRCQCLTFGELFVFLHKILIIAFNTWSVT